MKVKILLILLAMLGLTGCDISLTSLPHQKILSNSIYTVCASGQEFIRKETVTSRDGGKESIEILLDKDGKPKTCNY